MTEIEFTITAEMVESHRKWRLGIDGGARLVAPAGSVVLLAADIATAGLDLSMAVFRGVRFDAGSRFVGSRFVGSTFDGSRFVGSTFDGSTFVGSGLADIVGIHDAPVVPSIDRAIRQAVDAGGGFDMGNWHCGTTHCRGGWAISLCGEPGRALESRVGSWMAAALIYEASRPGVPIPDFYASTKDAMADIRACAEKGGAK